MRPVSQTSAFARREAFSSTGSVTTWKSTTSEKSAIPSWMSPKAPSRKPPSSRIQETLEAKLAGRASTWRNISGW